MAHKLAARFMPGPLTLVLKKNDGVDTGIGRGMSTIGIRIPDNQFCLELARAFDGPITTTSANRAGEPPKRSVDAILAQLGDTASMIDFVIDAGELPSRLPSTVIDLSGERPVILREGAIATSDVWDALIELED